MLLEQPRLLALKVLARVTVFLQLSLLVVLKAAQRVLLFLQELDLKEAFIGLFPRFGQIILEEEVLLKKLCDIFLLLLLIGVHQVEGFLNLFPLCIHLVNL